jgi:Na+-transporting methylmalonyl-CoA/oxaloacetate decarboxylase gamma subunit
VGQEIGFAEVIWISLFGMAVATVAVILMMIFVIAMSKVLAKTKWGASPTLQPAASIAGTVSEEEIVCIMAALYKETGMSPSQFRVVSITSR